jgi:hypothetical protein
MLLKEKQFDPVQKREITIKWLLIPDVHAMYQTPGK